MLQNAAGEGGIPNSASKKRATSTPSRTSKVGDSKVLVTPERPSFAQAQLRTSSLSSPGSTPGSLQPAYTPPYMPSLFALLDFNSPDATALTAGEKEVLAMVLCNYNLPDPRLCSLGPISGMTSEKLILRAYYNGRLSVKEGKEQLSLVCSTCGKGSHSPSSCTT